MARRPFLLLGAIALLLASCEAKIGKEADKHGAQGNGSENAESPAEGKSKDGEFSIKAPGLDMKIDIPGGVTSRVGSDSDLLFPGSTFSGMHIEGSKSGRGNSGVELRFTSSVAPEKVAAWYRDPARAGIFSIESARRDGAGTVIAGKETKSGDPFTLRLDPRSGGGTDARLTLSDRG